MKIKMTHRNEEEVEELFSEQPATRDPTRIHLQSQPKTESFDKFVLDEVMIARAMMKGSSPVCASSLSEKQRQRAVKLREGIASRTEQLFNAAKPSRNSVDFDGREQFRLEDWLRPQAKNKRALPPLAGKETDGGRDSACKESALKDSGKSGVVTKPLNKGIQVDFGLEGWSVPPIATILPFGTTNQIDYFGSDAGPKKAAKSLCQEVDSDSRTNLLSEVLGSNFSVEVNASDKAHAISSRPIEECFQNVVAKRKQGDHNRFNGSDQKPSSPLGDKGKKKEKLQNDKVVLQSRKSGDVSLTKLAADITDLQSGSGTSRVDVNAGTKIPGADDVKSSATDKVDGSKSLKVHSRVHALAKRKTEGSIVLPPLQTSSLSKQSPLKKKYPTITRTLTSDFQDRLARQHLPSPSGFAEGVSMHPNPIEPGGQNSYLKTGNFAKSDFHYPRNSLNWNTLLEDAGKQSSYKQIHVQNTREQEPESQEVGYLQKHLKTLSHRKTDINSRQHNTVQSVKENFSTPKRSRPIDILLEKEVQLQYPFVHYDSESKSLSSLSDWTGVPQQSPVRGMKTQVLQLNFPTQQDSGSNSTSHFRKDTLLNEQKKYYQLNSGKWQS